MDAEGRPIVHQADQNPDLPATRGITNVGGQIGKYYRFAFDIYFFQFNLTKLTSLLKHDCNKLVYIIKI